MQSDIRFMSDFGGYLILISDLGSSSSVIYQMCHHQFSSVLQPCQTMMVWGHRRTRRSTSQLTAPPLCLPRCPPTQWTQPWASCRPSPPLWQQVRTPAPIYTRNLLTPRCLRTLPKTANARVAAKGATPSPSPAPVPRPPPQRNTRRPQSPPCSMVVPLSLPRRNR